MHTPDKDDKSIDDRFEGFVEETTQGGTTHGYAVKEGIIYEIVNGKAVRIYGRVVNRIAYKYDEKGHLHEIGKLDS